MPKFHLDEDEHYPVYSLKEPNRYNYWIVELTDEQYADYLRVQEAYYEWQERLENWFKTKPTPVYYECQKCGKVMEEQFASSPIHRKYHGGPKCNGLKRRL